MSPKLIPSLLSLWRLLCFTMPHNVNVTDYLSKVSEFSLARARREKQRADWLFHPT